MEGNLGTTLRSARESLDLTIDDAVYRAKMPRAVVEALEADDFGYFASPLYARSFLRQYGDYVGVDVSPWIDDIVPTPLIDSESAEAFLDITEPETAAPVRQRAKTAAGGGAMAAVWLIVITGGLIWAGVAYFQRLDEKLSVTPPATRESPATPPDPVQEEQEQQLEPGPAEQEERPVASTEPNAPKRAIIVNLPEEE